MHSHSQSKPATPSHPALTRRSALQAGAVGLLGLGVNHVQALRALAGPAAPVAKARSVIFIFLSGGLSQLDSFDPKPDAPEGIRGEFGTIPTRTVGIRVCEHLPRLAQRSDKWALVRSLTHPYNAHSAGHLAILTGQTAMPAGFDPNEPRPGDWPSLASVAGALMRRRNNLPPAVVLPEKLVHVTGRTIPGQFAGMMGREHDPWLVEASHFRSREYIHGAFPEYGFERRSGAYAMPDYQFEAPRFTLPDDVGASRFGKRLDLLGTIDRQRADLDATAPSQGLDRSRQEAVSLLMAPAVHRAFDVKQAPLALQERYGRNSFGWSLLMARQLVEAGVNLVQVNLGNNESWDNHEAIFRNLSRFLLPPTDRAVSALLDDLDERGLLESTLVVMASEFGRTPRIFGSKEGSLPGRDHWGAVQTAFFAGGGVRGGRVIGASDRIGAQPASLPQRPENMAATIYQALGLPPTAAWEDKTHRPHYIYHGDPIPGLTS
ncbi:MAG: DUF1501 domain-containing protein [Gemmataceae bacterium]|nr:DUF1501 domain-containing protein [Gemmataceae bacterium]